MAVVAGLVAAHELRRPAPPEDRTAPLRPLGAGDGATHLAGSGTWIPLARALASAYHEARRERVRPVVHASIGSGGGRNAVEAGVIDIGLVAVTAGQRVAGGCCRSVPVARAAVALLANGSVEKRNLTTDEVREIFSGERTRWPNGELVVPLLREEGDSATRAASKVLAGLGPALSESRSEHRFPILLTDEEMSHALEATPGSLGLHDLGALTLERRPLRVLALDGVLPGHASLVAGTYPVTRILSMLLALEPSRATLDFIEFVGSPAGQSVIERGGYLPLAHDSRDLPGGAPR